MRVPDRTIGSPKVRFLLPSSNGRISASQADDRGSNPRGSICGVLKIIVYKHFALYARDMGSNPIDGSIKNDAVVAQWLEH